jgi:hypothetical protein
MDDSERAKRREAIKALGRNPPSSAEIRDKLRLTRKDYAFPKIRSCWGHDCRTVVFGGGLCTFCSFTQAEIEIAAAHAWVERAQITPEAEVDVAHATRARDAQEVNDLPNNRGPRVSPVGLAVVCLMIVFSLVAAYAQKHEESRVSAQQIAGD